MIVDEVFKITESSTKDTRKEFEKILELIRKSRETIALVADTIDRVQRSFKESVVLDNLRKDGKVEIHFMREGLVLNLRSNSSDILRWDMSVMFARSYVLQLSDNIKRSKEQAAKRGVWMGLAPTGYIHVTNDKGEKTIIPDPDRAPFIRKLFEMYATGNHSLQTLKTAAIEMGLRTKKGEPFAISQINKILNPSCALNHARALPNLTSKCLLVRDTPCILSLFWRILMHSKIILIYLQEFEGIRLIADRKTNAARQHLGCVRYMQGFLRKRIETTFSQLTSMFPRKIHAVTKNGFLLKLVIFIVSYSLKEMPSGL